MTDANGDTPAEAVLAGHLVIYPDAVAFRPDGAGDDQVIIHHIGQVVREWLLHLLTTKDLGVMTSMLKMDSPMGLLNRDQRRAVKAAARKARVPDGED